MAAGVTMLGCGSPPAAGPRTTPGARTAEQLYAAYVGALRAARSEHYSGTVAFSDGTSVGLDVTATQTTAHLVAHMDGISVEEIVAAGHAYQRGGGHGPDWVVLPADEARSAEALTLQRDADCAAREHGHLSMGPQTVIGGRRVAAIVDDGRAPGASPGTGYLTLDGPIRLLRAVQTGAESPGGSADCGHQPGPVSVSATVDYDSFDGPVQIDPPPHPVDISGPTV
jgi:hypothetical protein